MQSKFSFFSKKFSQAAQGSPVFFQFPARTSEKPAAAISPPKIPRRNRPAPWQSCRQGGYPLRTVRSAEAATRRACKGQTARQPQPSASAAGGAGSRTPRPALPPQDMPAEICGLLSPERSTNQTAQPAAGGTGFFVGKGGDLPFHCHIPAVKSL